MLSEQRPADMPLKRRTSRHDAMGYGALLAGHTALFALGDMPPQPIDHSLSAKIAILIFHDGLQYFSLYFKISKQVDDDFAAARISFLMRPYTYGYATGTFTHQKCDMPFQ